MDLNPEELEEAVKSVGCTLKESSGEYYLMLPGNFPWYGGDDVKETENSRIIATFTLSWGEWKWTNAWACPAIHEWHDEPLGIEMRNGNSIEYNDRALDELRSFNYEQLKSWLEAKIGEVSRMAKECRKKAIRLPSKKYEV